MKLLAVIALFSSSVFAYDVQTFSCYNNEFEKNTMELQFEGHQLKEATFKHFPSLHAPELVTLNASDFRVAFGGNSKQEFTFFDVLDPTVFNFPPYDYKVGFNYLSGANGKKLTLQEALVGSKLTMRFFAVPSACHEAICGVTHSYTCEVK